MSHSQTKKRKQQDAEAIRARWEWYVQHGREDENLRNELLEYELPKLRKLAEKMSHHFCLKISAEELAQEGLIAMVDVAKRYDPLTKYTFWTFATHRVRGAMLDLARTQDYVSRLQRGLSQKRIQFSEQFVMANGRQPTREEVMAQFGWSASRYSESLVPELSSLDKPLPDSKGDSWEPGSVYELLAACVDDPECHEQVEAFARELLKGLTMDQQTMFWLYFIRGATMKNIGLVFGLSESRVSQLMSSTKEHMLRTLSRDKMFELAA